MDESDSPDTQTLYVTQTMKGLYVRIEARGGYEVRRLKLDRALQIPRFNELTLVYHDRGDNQGMVNADKCVLSQADLPRFEKKESYPDSRYLWNDAGSQPSKYKINEKAFSDCTARGL